MNCSAGCSSEPTKLRQGTTTTGRYQWEAVNRKISMDKDKPRAFRKINQIITGSLEELAGGMTTWGNGVVL